MAKGSEFHTKPGGLGAKVPKKFVERQLLPVSPRKQQFEPTTADPVRQQYRMAGGGK